MHMHRSRPSRPPRHCPAPPRAQDGTIQHETKLTGCLSTNVLSEGEGPLPEHGTLLAPGLNAQHHQHFFCARLDPAVDDPAGGAALTVVEVQPRSKRERARRRLCLAGARRRARARTMPRRTT